VRYSVSIDNQAYEVELTPADGRWHCRINGRDISVDFAQVGPATASILTDGKSFEVRRDSEGYVVVGNRSYKASVDDPRSWQGRRRRELGQTGAQRLTASMPGKVVRVLAREGETIQAGQGIVVIEAMKMQNEVKSAKAGVLQKLMVREGVNVNAGEILAIVE
jgi:biotin carboxyl carrier protein